MTLENLLEIRAIEQLKYRYMRALDTHNWSLMAQCFTEDADVWYGDGLYRFSGLSEIVKFFESVVTPSFVGSHVALHPEIDLILPDRANGIWRMQDIVHVVDANTEAKEAEFKGGEKMEGAGYYYDDYRKINEDWFIQSTGYIRIFETVTLGSGRPGEKLKIDARRGVRD